jgi:hypothetical protein
MEVRIEIPKYDVNNGIKYNWENGFEIEIRNSDGTI